ncbi:hypothetical protein F5X71_14190 [Nocardia brasiliensis]|uniref:Protein-arginine deiminase C-terminal domain-containing protein n=1 Tax=Nocardia brasiliensis TaxID=37326 RepID=A0A6G9XR60_NOCBR|nr:protein-arginine deiminase family protein [Nocardia brasiliensis]QIS03313.1 hypothetical protein F5X71_14190 [Nocardia brasiliensis]
MAFRSIWLLAGVAALALSGCAAATADRLDAQIRADSNRDGVVDDKDVDAKANGAVILPNIGDSARRCPTSTSPLSDAELAACHDAADDVARAPEYLAPLVTMPVGTAAGASGQVAVVGAGADKIRLFIRRADAWVPLHPDTELTERELREGAILGVDARDVLRDRAIWDGAATVRFTVRRGARTVTDDVVVRVAPVVLHNHTQPARSVLVPESGDDRAHERFVGELGAAAKASGIDAPLIRLRTTDTWGQDFVEFGYVSMPGLGGTNVSLRIAIRSPQPEREGGRAVFDLKGPGTGAIQLGGFGARLVDAFGNVETIPPHTNNGREFPTGRVIIGIGNGDDPGLHSAELEKFFAAQQVQEPVLLDAGWLVVGHVDEFVQFLPSSGGRGWRPAVSDPRRGLEILRAQQRAGHGAAPALSRPGAAARTIDEVLADERFVARNEVAARKIDENVDRLIRAVGLAREEFVRIPGLYESGGVEEAPEALVGFYPGAINGVLMNAANYVAPRQWGPVVDGRDVFEAAVTEAYRSVGLTVRYVDDWEALHLGGGEVHCGTNVLRQIEQRWIAPQ